MAELPEDVVILLVDDSENDLMIITRAMKRAQLRNRTIPLHDGEEAKAYFQGFGIYADRQQYPLPGLVLLDLKMPRIDGFELLGWIRQQSEFKELPVVVLTSSELL